MTAKYSSSVAAADNTTAALHTVLQQQVIGKHAELLRVRFAQSQA